MSRWNQTVAETAEDARRFWAEAPLQTLYDMMDTPRWAWEEWLKVAAGVVTAPGRVFEAGCGIGLLTRFLPPGCTYYGCDINAAYVEEATRRYGRPGVTFEQRDLYDVLGSGERFDWVLIPSLFGMFPEEESYGLIRRLWEVAGKGLSVTTINKRLLPRHRLMRFEFTGHDPEEMASAGRALPGAGRVEIHHGREFPRFQGHHWGRGLALYVWRTTAPSG